jgi:hypothetical protein
MSVSYTPNPLDDVVRAVDFSLSISFSAGSGTITSVTGELLGEVEPIIITPAGNSLLVSGKYLSGWTDTFTYVDAGESNLTQAPKTAIGTENLPASQNLFDLDQDQTYIVVRQFSVTVEYTEDSLPYTTTFLIDHNVYNNLEAMRSFMDNYNYNGGEL